MPSDRTASCCSFCTKPAAQVRYLIVGRHGVCICDACVLRASETLALMPRPQLTTLPSARSWWRGRRHGRE